MAKAGLLSHLQPCGGLTPFAIQNGEEVKEALAVSYPIITSNGHCVIWGNVEITTRCTQVHST